MTISSVIINEEESPSSSFFIGGLQTQAVTVRHKRGLRELFRTVALTIVIALFAGGNSFSTQNNLQLGGYSRTSNASLASPIAQTLSIQGTIWGVDKYVLEADYANISMDTWKANLNSGWEWDKDQLYMNFLLHPVQGGMYFNTARSLGFSFYQSIPFTFGGSLVWEYLGERDRPSLNDMVNTSLSGVLVGEIMFRLSSNILDDRTTGSERFFRELAAGLVNPVRGLNRLMTGSTGSTGPGEIYQKEPINITASAGTRLANEGSSFGTGKRNQMVDVNLEYGDPFRNRVRAPFDYFTFWGNLNFGEGYKLTDNVVSKALLYGRNRNYNDLEVLAGIFQYFDYWDSWTFELASLGFGGGVATRLPLGGDKRLVTNLHVGAIPLAGHSRSCGPTDLDTRDYSYGNGLQASLDSTLMIGRMHLTFVGYYYWIHTYVGDNENNSIGILKPRISFDLNDFLSVGFEQMFYLQDRFAADATKISLERTEQRLYISYYFRDPSFEQYAKASRLAASPHEK